MVGRRRQRQHQGFESCLRKTRRNLARSLAIEANAKQLRTALLERAKIVWPRIADGGIETAAAVACRNCVPQTDRMRPQPQQPFFIRNLAERLIQHGRQQRPELIARMRIILRRRQRGLAGKAAENQNPGLLTDHRRQAGKQGGMLNNWHGKITWLTRLPVMASTQEYQ